MLVILVSFVLTAVVVAKLGRRANIRPSDLGTMSAPWLAEHQSAQHASSL
jgi:hypothetical protein